MHLGYLSEQYIFKVLILNFLMGLNKVLFCKCLLIDPKGNLDFDNMRCSQERERVEAYIGKGGKVELRKGNPISHFPYCDVYAILN